MNRVIPSFVLSILVCLVAANSAQADVVTFTDRPTFNTAAPGLPTETFETSTAGAGIVVPCAGPVSSATINPCFPAGGLLPGVVYSANPGVNLVVLGANFATLGNTSRVLGPNFFGDSLNLTFANANAVGFDLFAGPAAGDVLVTIFDAASVQIGSFTVAAPLGGTFFGVISTAAIGRINIASQTTQPGEVIDNVAFGPANTVPEPGTMLLLGTGLSGLIAAARRRGKSLAK